MIQHTVLWKLVNKLVEWHVYLDKSRATRLSQISYVYPPPTQTRDVHKHPEIRSTLSASILLVFCSITSPKSIQSESFFFPFLLLSLSWREKFHFSNLFVYTRCTKTHWRGYKGDTKENEKRRISFFANNVGGIFIAWNFYWQVSKNSKIFFHLKFSTFVCVTVSSV